MGKSHKRVVITGIGAVTPFGVGKEKFWDGSVEGRTCFRKSQFVDTSKTRTKLVAEIQNFNAKDFIKKNRPERVDRFSQLGVAAAKLAFEDSGLQGPPEGVFIGSGVGGMLFYEEQCDLFRKNGSSGVHPISIPKIMPNSVSANLAIELGIEGPNITISTACSSAIHALGVAFDQIRMGRIKSSISGGTEAPILPVLFSAFDKLHVMSRETVNPNKACRPFDLDRDGFILGEGSAIFVLEEYESALKRNARIYAEILGYGASNGTFHLVRPDPSGGDVIKTMEFSLKDARISPETVDYIHAHGTGTKANDEIETLAIKSVFGVRSKELAISSSKSVVGHLLGASAAVGVMSALLSMQHGLVPPTANLTNNDPKCDLNYTPLKAVNKKINVSMINAFGFGNNNGSLILGQVN